MENETQNLIETEALNKAHVGRSAFDFKIIALARLYEYLEKWRNQRTSKKQKSVSASIGNCIKIIMNIED